MTKKIYNAISETEFVLVEDPLNKRRTTSNERILVSDIPNTIFEENFITTPGQGKIPASILSVDFVKSEHFLILFLQENAAIILLEIFQ